MRMVIKWTPNEIKFLKYHYFSYSNRKLSKILKRDLKSIQMKAFQLGLTNKSNRKPIAYIEANPFNLKAEEWAYIAGIFDGEGSLPHNKRCNFTVDIINSTNEEAINWIYERFPGSRKYTIVKDKNRKVAWRVALHKRNYIFWFMIKISKYTIIKKNKISEWINKYKKWYLPRNKEDINALCIF